MASKFNQADYENMGDNVARGCIQIARDCGWYADPGIALADAATWAREEYFSKTDAGRKTSYALDVQAGDESEWAYECFWRGWNAGILHEETLRRDAFKSAVKNSEAASPIIVDGALGNAWEYLGAAIRRAGGEDSSGYRRHLSAALARREFASVAAELKITEAEAEELRAHFVADFGDSPV